MDNSYHYLSYQKCKNYFSIGFKKAVKKLTLNIHIGSFDYSLIKNWLSTIDIAGAKYC